MIRHVVMFSVTGDDADAKAASAGALRDLLTSLVGAVPQLRHLEVGTSLGRVDGHWDVVLVTDFDSVDDLDAYQVHPEHQRVVGAMAPLVHTRAVVDYEASTTLSA